MTVVSVSRTIPAPAADIFAMLADPARHSEFDGSGTVRDSTKTRGPLKLGSRFTTSMHLVVPYQMVNTIIEFEEDRLIAWQPYPAYPLIGRLVGGRIWRYELEPVDGGTKVTESWDITKERIPLAVRGYGTRVSKDMAKTLERLEDVLTGVASRE